MKPAIDEASLARVFRGKRVPITGHTRFRGGWMALWLKRLGAEVGARHRQVQGRERCQSRQHEGAVRAGWTPLMSIEDAVAMSVNWHRACQDEPDSIRSISEARLDRYAGDWAAFNRTSAQAPCTAGRKSDISQHIGWIVKLSIIGTGYVGLVTGACLASIGHKVVCVDRIASRIDKISQAETPFYEPGLDRLVAETIATGMLTASTDLRSAVETTDITLIAVGTPDFDGHIDLSQIEAAAADIGEVLRTKSVYHVVAVKSTVVPGTTDGVVGQTLEGVAQKRIGADIGCA